MIVMIIKLVLILEVVTEQASMTVDGLLSSIGGALSLYIGITVVSFFELFEFLVLLIRSDFSTHYTLCSFSPSYRPLCNIVSIIYQWP